MRNKIICEIKKVCQIGLTRHFAIIHMAITLFSKNEHLASEYFVTTLLMSTITDCCLITLSSSNLDCGGSQTWTSVWTNLIMISRNWEKQLWNWHLKTAPFTYDSLFQWINLYRYTCCCLVYNDIKWGLKRDPRLFFMNHNEQVSSRYSSISKHVLLFPCHPFFTYIRTVSQYERKQHSNHKHKCQVTTG